VIGPSQRHLPDSTQNRQTTKSLAGFEPAIPASKRPQTTHCGHCDIMFVCLFVSFWPTARQLTRPSHSWVFYITHNDAPQSVGFHWKSDQLVAQTSTWQHTTRQISMPPDRIRTHNPSKLATANLRLRPRDRWDRQSYNVAFVYWPKLNCQNIQFYIKNMH
jgi:hypothetical protein